MDKGQVPQTGQGVKYKIGLGTADWTELRRVLGTLEWTRLKEAKKKGFTGRKCGRQAPYFGQNYQVV